MNPNPQESNKVNNIKKSENRVNRYPQLQGQSIGQKIAFYDKKLKDYETQKIEHKNRINNIKLLKSSFVNISQFKLDEMSKKMKNEITRLGQEQSRHEESQANESKKIQAQVDFLRDTNNTITKVLDLFLQRVVALEQNLGPPK